MLAPPPPLFLTFRFDDIRRSRRQLTNMAVFVLREQDMPNGANDGALMPASMCRDFIQWNLQNVRDDDNVDCPQSWQFNFGETSLLPSAARYEL
jgi:hypothetical protein